MAKINFYTSLITAKIIKSFLNVSKLSSGTSIIGKIVLNICPEFLQYANKYVKTKINITGTNGKTTTSGLITHILSTNGNSVINNAMGANMLNGVVNTLATTITPLKKYDFSVIESDEAYLSKIYDKYDADYLLVTNLFRDQLDRYGELETTKRLIQEGIDKKRNLKLVLNSDDPLVSSFSGGIEKIYYGVDEVEYADGENSLENNVEESFNCPCGKSLNYSKKFYAQQGHYYCDCGYSRPKPKYSAKITLHKHYSLLNINGKEYKVPLVGLFNAYNALGAISIALELGIDNIQDSLNSFEVAFGRSEIKYLNGNKTLIQLIKNPIGANEVLKTVDIDSNILIIINDKYADGRDVSWLWDAQFEHLQNAKNEITVSGIRAEDMALRLKYAGIPAENIKIIKDIDNSIDYMSKKYGDITILPTYTALLKINKNTKLKKLKINS